MTNEMTYNKKYMKRYQHKNAAANILKSVLMLVMCICVLHLSGCATHEDSSLDGANSCVQMLGGMRLGSEIVVIDYREVWYFEPWVKVYYLEEEKWGMCGFEQNAELAEKLALNQLKLKEDEHIVYIKIWDYQVSDYVEEILYSVVDDEVNTYCIVADREGNFWGSMKDENIKYGLEILKGATDNPGDGAFYFKPITYEARYKIQDVNEDGYPDLYNWADLYLWDNNGYRACSESERRMWLDELLQTNADRREIEERNIYATTYSNLVEKDDGAIMYLQFHDIANANRMNEQIRSLVEERKEEDLNVYVKDIVYVGDKYLVLFMYSQNTGWYDKDGEPVYNDCRYLTFCLDTGDLVTLDDILGENYTREDAEELVWKAYERKIEEVPDQYSEFLFEEYGLNIFRKYDKELSGVEEGHYKPVLENYLHYYCTEEGIIILYGHETMHPMNYFLNERLGRIESTDVVEMFCPWEEIILDK